MWGAAAKPRRRSARERRRPCRRVTGYASDVRAARWEPERPVAKSLWLLPSGPDQVGDDHARPTPARPMAEPGGSIKA